MPSAWVLTNVAIIVVSVLAGLMFFYIISPLTKNNEKATFGGNNIITY